MEKNWVDMSVAEKLQEAIANAKAITLPGATGNYFESCCDQRDSRKPGHAGSVFAREFLQREDGTEETVEHRLFRDHLPDWQEYPDCPGLQEGCEAFILRYKPGVGFVGVIPVDTLTWNTRLKIDDRKHTGYASVVADIPAYGNGTPTDHVVAIVGDEGGKKTLFTFHPGNPVKPSVCKIDGVTVKDGMTIDADQAQTMGFEWVKLS